MLMCEPQAYSGYVTSLMTYPLDDGEGEYSDSGYSHTLSSSDSDHWTTLSGVEGEDDVFTGREVVLSYDGCELSESDCNKDFKEELDDQESSFQSEISISMDDSDVKNININEINCTDSFLEWLDSEQDLGSPSTEYYTESDESTNENDSVDLQTEYSQHPLAAKSLPPIQTMIPAGSTIIHAFPMDKCYPARDTFNSLIRGSATSLHVDVTVDGVSDTRGEYGHLLCSDEHNSENSYTSYYTTYPENQVVIQQSKGELLEKLRQRESASVPQTDKCLLECRWENCWAVFVGQAALVRHIEKTHVELRRADEFACLWQDCPRRTRPFNARYKLLIHMRVHSGEKPNKCPFPGCLKAFSRLENLKIHQRSHTGERPYCCQFPACAKAFSNSSDRAKHQRTHYDTKPYACQVAGCRKRYTDPSSLRKHIKNHAGAAACKAKKLIASEPVVTISNIEQRQRERLNSYASECTSDYQEEEYLRSDCVEGGLDCESYEAADCGSYEAADCGSYEAADSSRLADFDGLDNDIENHFFDDSHFDDSDFLTFADDEMLNLLCK